MSEGTDSTSQVNTDNVNLSISDNVVVNEDNKTTVKENELLLKTLKSHSQKIKVINEKIEHLNSNQQQSEENNDEHEEEEDENLFEIGCIVDVLQLETNKYINGKIVEIDENGLFKLDYGGGQSETQVNVRRMKIPR